MIALTSRLNERDETIIQLQEELDVYERLQKEGEDIKYAQVRRIKTLEEELRKNSLLIPDVVDEQERHLLLMGEDDLEAAGIQEIVTTTGGELVSP